jgi:peptidoglycan/xylan/chitin deacetylase (PgdA/CDA1 family)
MRTAIRSALHSVFSISGAGSLTRAKLRRHLLVLCYHGVVANEPKDRFGYGNTVSIEEFRNHLRLLARHFHPVTMADVIADRSSGRGLPDGAALVTFDDGYRNNLTHAAPVLREARIPCVFHVSTAYIGTRNILWTDEVIGRIIAFPGAKLPLPGEAKEQDLPQDLPARRAVALRIKERCKRLDREVVSAWLEKLRSLSDEPRPNPELYDFMTWDEVRELRSQGFDIGSHTVSHPILTRISPGDLAWELSESKRTIEREVNAPCEAIAYPNGGAADVSESVFAATRNAGYKLGFTVAERHSPPDEDALSISRLCIQGHLPLSAFSFRVDGGQRLLNAGAPR